MSGILVLNAGSSSLKFALFDDGLRAMHGGSVTEIGGAARVELDGDRKDCGADSHEAALALCLDALAQRGIRPGDLSAAAHRVVHGGARLTCPCRITPVVLDDIAACIPFAPLHNPHNLAAIRAMRRLAPDLPQTASFDTAFHATNPDVALRYAIPRALHDAGIRRYGFHGISYASLVARLPALSGIPLPRRLLALHLGNGASLCAILDGRSVATTMGYSPLDGLTMGTRAGGIDGNAVLAIADRIGPEATARLLNRKSGLLGLGGASDMRALRGDPGPEAAFAVAHFCYWAMRHAGSMIAAMGGIDAIAFTGGIGEHDSRTRGAIVAGLGWVGAELDEGANDRHQTALHAPGSRVTIWRVPAEEERRIAEDALTVLSGTEAGRG
jgi:acetate kinase